jgi:hypothetical protein
MSFAVENARDRPSSIESRASDGVPDGPSQIQTPYMIMSIQANEARPWYNVCAGVCAWLTLAGYVVLPSTFTSLQRSGSLNGTKEGRIIQSTVRNLPLLPLASISCLVGISGTSWLWWKWRRNYGWLLGRIFWSVGQGAQLMPLTDSQGLGYHILSSVYLQRLVMSWPRRVGTSQ